MLVIDLFVASLETEWRREGTVGISVADSGRFLLEH